MVSAAVVISLSSFKVTGTDFDFSGVKVSADLNQFIFLANLALLYFLVVFVMRLSEHFVEDGYKHFEELYAIEKTTFEESLERELEQEKLHGKFSRKDYFYKEKQDESALIEAEYLAYKRRAKLEFVERMQKKVKNMRFRLRVVKVFTWFVADVGIVVFVAAYAMKKSNFI
ncbi:hypothetical protein [Thalassospira lucentensis]|uniref:hypothetical protein n=1 Tax=Thalassospira lucentensis TaxID=168935 RepID=UPI00142D8562|nr:hypothetical protein [Thalassospira lucentensis]NIZ02000.1 hypothetical protein [Thalassospira lucentensis]